MTFTELFEKSELDQNFFGELGYILDAPDAIFNTVKEDMAATLNENFDVAALMKEISGVEELSITEIKQDMIDTYNLFEQLLNDEDFKDLPKDRVEFFLSLLGTMRDKCLELPERKTVEIIYEKVTEDATLPTYAHNTDAGADIYANEDFEIAGGMTAAISTGIKVAVPVGWELQIRPRSGMSLKTPIRIANAPGTIDSGFRDEVKVLCHNTSPYPYSIKKGDRIAQFIPKLCPMIVWKEGKVADIEGDRKGGFGSTGE